MILLTQDRVHEVKSRRSRPLAADQPARSVNRDGAIAATIRDDRCSAERAERIGMARRGILRDCYDQSLEVAEQAADDAMIPRRKKVAGKENAIKYVPYYLPINLILSSVLMRYYLK